MTMSTMASTDFRFRLSNEKEVNSWRSEWEAQAFVNFTLEEQLLLRRFLLQMQENPG